jgi:hypothetical protein
VKNLPCRKSAQISIRDAFMDYPPQGGYFKPISEK